MPDVLRHGKGRRIMTEITHEFAGDKDMVWAAEGMMHRISITHASDGYMIIQVEGIKNQDKWTSSGTLSPEEQKSLARALDPESFEALDRLRKYALPMLDSFISES